MASKHGEIIVTLLATRSTLNAYRTTSLNVSGTGTVASGFATARSSTGTMGSTPRTAEKPTALLSALMVGGGTVMQGGIGQGMGLSHSDKTVEKAQSDGLKDAPLQRLKS